MCVLALAWRAHPHWILVAAGNRDERHDRPSLPLGRWMARKPVIAGRDALAGGTWLGVSESGRFAAVTNVRGEAPAQGAMSRGTLVTDFLAGEEPDDLAGYNPFNLIAVDGDGPMYMSNRPDPVRRPLSPGLHGLSNGLLGTLWPKTLRMQTALRAWLDEGSANVEPLFQALADARPAGAAERYEPDANEPVNSPVFIRNPVYGTRASTVVTVDHLGRGLIAERRFNATGSLEGESVVRFSWG
ncbi:NRDE family protein [Sphingomonas sp.]|uniref:NRDE family protein n=1 Tax=Sphingomonas sp. TaxID=28214 RepID=UPI001EB0BF3C|nr:NRDE family protein [Sphingomonas sp.]MBX3593713.1 NRDE family protein [Sphingomonas sp.]